MAVRFAALFEVLLMILFGAPELAGGDDLGHNRLGKLRLSRFARRASFHQLLRRVVENGRAVLRAHIGTLPVERGRVVIAPEDIEQVVIADYMRVEGDLDNFCMACAIGADVFIGWIFCVPAHVADLGRLHSSQAAKRSLHAPKAAGTKTGLAELRLHTLIVPPRLAGTRKDGLVWVLPKLRVTNQTRGRMLADRADIADTSAKRRTGLLKHKGLAPGEGLWIVPCEGVHTFAMKFPIDVVFLNRKRKILKVRPNMVRRRIALSLMAHSVLELPAGTLEQTGTERGDQLKLEEYEYSPGA